MKVSEAIMLGSFSLTRKAGTLAGCALGMAAEAQGIPKSYTRIHKRWPWLLTKRRGPCDCPGLRMMAPADDIIIHLFDDHVMEPEDDFTPWTLEQLADWVRKVEPQDTDHEQADGWVGTHPTEQSSEHNFVDAKG